MPATNNDNISWNNLDALRADLVEQFSDNGFLNEVLKGVMRVARGKGNPIRGNLVAYPFRWRDGRQRRGGFSRARPRPLPRRRLYDHGADGAGQAACTGIDIGIAG